MIAQTKFQERIQILLQQENHISTKRKKELVQLATIIFQQKNEMGFSNVNFVCTHNSRRSQLAQIWFWYALHHFGIEQIKSYSGGTEATAFNHRMVEAVLRFGFLISKLDDSENPNYKIQIGEERSQYLFSKKFLAESNPQKDFIAVMVCSHADENCPLVPGTYARIPLRYEDPKVADNTPSEAKSYDNKVLEIGREILYLVGFLKKKLNEN